MKENNNLKYKSEREFEDALLEIIDLIFIQITNYYVFKMRKSYN